MRSLPIAVLGLLAAAGLALAQSTDKRRSDRDDSRSRVDISSVRGTHNVREDRLVHVIRFHKAISPRNFRNAIESSGPPGTVCVNIWTGRKPGEGEPNYDVCVTGNRDLTGLRAGVARHKANGAVRQAANAKAELTSPRRLVIDFDPDAIKRPTAYRWSVQSTTFEKGCKKHLGCLDFAPNGGRSVRTKL